MTKSSKIVLFAMMLIREMGSVGRQTKQMIFFNIAISHMLYFVSDIAWVFVLNGNIPHTALYKEKAELGTLRQ